jgi:putative ABC transport system substrate-binding protein
VSKRVRRRQFIGLLGGAVTASSALWSIGSRAQQPAVPLVGVLRSTPAAPFAHLIEALRQGLKDEGLAEGRNFALEQRWANNQLGRLPELTADLIRRQVSVIVGNQQAVAAAKAATTTIPIVFVVADDPVKSGLVANLNRPTENLTGVTFFGGSELNPKRLELLHELVPKAATVAILLDPNYEAFVQELPDTEAAARALGLRTVVVKTGNEAGLAAAFTTVAQSGAGAMLVSGGPFFTSQRRALVELAARHRIPAIYDLVEFVQAGGLISYSASIAGAYRQAGIYAGKILKGAKPSDLPVLQPITFELALNLKTARTLGLNVPPSIQLRAEHVIE